MLGLGEHLREGEEVTDDRRSLNAILDELHGALEDSPEVGEEARASLKKTAEQIRQALEAPENPEGESLRDQLSAAVERFEVAHPRLTGLVGRIADAMSDLGI